MAVPVGSNVRPYTWHTRRHRNAGVLLRNYCNCCYHCECAKELGDTALYDGLWFYLFS